MNANIGHCRLGDGGIGPGQEGGGPSAGGGGGRSDTVSIVASSSNYGSHPKSCTQQGMTANSVVAVIMELKHFAIHDAHTRIKVITCKCHR
jgi:hypothetical protein